MSVRLTKAVDVAIAAPRGSTHMLPDPSYRRLILVATALGIVSVVLPSTGSAEEITLFESNGSPVAYIDTNDDLNIYLWEGEPVAYLEGSGGSTFDVYGFNGKHLGWFENGAIWDRSGNATCAIREALRDYPRLEPLKPLQKLAPLKSLPQLPPLQPRLTGRFGSLPCVLHLGTGRK